MEIFICFTVMGHIVAIGSIRLRKIIVVLLVRWYHFLKAKPFADDGERLNIWDSWYVALEKGKNDDIHVLYNFHKCRSKNGVHVGERYNAYFMTLDTKTNIWRNINGKVLKLPLTKEDSDILTLAVETPGKWTHLCNLSFDKDLFPRIYWYEGEDNGTQYGGAKRLANYYWNGSEWIGGSIQFACRSKRRIGFAIFGFCKIFISFNQRFSFRDSLVDE